MNKYIEVILPEEAENLTVYYQKVCERENFDIAEAEEILKQVINYEHMQHVGNVEALRIEDVEDGIYQIYISGDEEYEFAPMLVSMPAWTEEGEQLQYEVSVTPKYTKMIQPEPEQITLVEPPIAQPPKTGDASESVMFGIFGVISFIIVVIMSCHNRFKCARMTE
ncbi:MAG: hypothetical protein IJE60_12505 [Tyzzerella sp.]|nr:hypothetical protein [Tyzzerella sp.]